MRCLSFVRPWLFPASLVVHGYVLIHEGTFLYSVVGFLCVFVCFKTHCQFHIFQCDFYRIIIFFFRILLLLFFSCVWVRQSVGDARGASAHCTRLTFGARYVGTVVVVVE